MRKPILLIFINLIIIYNFASAQTIFGIRILRSNYGANYINSYPPYTNYDYYNVTSTQDFFGSHFGVHLNERLQLILGLDINYNSYSFEPGSSSYSERKNSLLFFVPRLGIKYYFQQIKEKDVSIYFYADIWKTFVSYDRTLTPESSEEYKKIQKKVLEEVEDSIDPFGFTLALGGEYFFIQRFSLGAELGFKYSILNFKETLEPDYNSPLDYIVLSKPNKISQKYFFCFIAMTVNVFFN